MGHSLFEKLFLMAQCGGFPTYVTTEQIRLRIEPALLYAAPLLAVAPQSAYLLNQLQESLARRLLAPPPEDLTAGLTLFAKCGRLCRFGTKMIERAVLARARLLLLPPLHLGAKMFRAASSLAAVVARHSGRGLQYPRC